MEKTEDNKKVWHIIIIECVKLIKSRFPTLQSLAEQKNKSRKEVALYEIYRRVMVNIRAVFELSKSAYQNEGSLSMKLPVGILLRNCISDIITAFFLSQKDEKATGQLLDLWNRDYVKALFEEFEVYKDKIDFLGFEDTVNEHIFTMAIEDTYIQHLDLNENYNQIEPGKERMMWKTRKNADYIPDMDKNDLTLKQMAQKLSSDKQVGSCAKNLYAYYKYFSQWEHFSENGAGDAQANFGEDNINLPKVFPHISQALGLLFPCPPKLPPSE
jgi:hypothetical protein